MRNAMHTALSERYDSEFWFDKARLLDPYQAGQVVKARKRIPKQHQCNSGKIVAELEFGFWTALLYKRYQPTLVPPLLKKAFSNVTDIPRQERRAFLSDALGDIRRFRNRLFHHEPIWYFSDLCQKHNTILQLILWLSPSLFKVTQSLDRFHDVYRAGTLPFKAHLLALSESGFLTE